MRHIWPLLALFSLLTLLHADPTHLRCYTLPYESKEALRAMVKTIDGARYRIDAAIYSFTHKTIAKRLVNAAKRGVKVRIVFDRSSNLKNQKSQLGYLAKYRNIQTLLLEGRPYRKKGSERALMHMKVMIVDNRRIVTGSANWTYSAFGKNYEILCLIDDYALAKRLERSFERMVREAKPY
jgi:phosphatidylserine/phosphatidylglycerophosphate/cardiolipin synthase-like enzyme